MKRWSSGVFATTIHKPCGRRFWIWILIYVKNPILRTLVNSTYGDMFDTSMESCDQGLYFFALPMRPFSDLWGRYHSNIENMIKFLLVTMSFLDIEPRERLLLNALITGFISSSYSDKL